MSSERADESRGYSAVATSITFAALAGFVVSTRLITRLGFVRRCGADDFLIGAALLMSIGLTLCIALQQKHGLGRHFDTISSSNLTKMMKSFYASVVIYNLGLAVVKCSILSQFLRFFVTPTARRWCWGLMAVIIAFGFVSVFGSVFACTPISKFWDAESPGHCIDLMAFWFSNASFNIISDLSICILPVPVLRSLNLPKKQKIGLLLVFILGGFGCITSILRLHSLYIISRSTDVTWDNVGAATWSSVELNTGIVCACLPTLKPILSRFFPSMLSSRKFETVELRRKGYICQEDGTGGSNIHKSQHVEVQQEQTLTTWNDAETATSPSPPPKDHNYSWSISGPADSKSPRSHHTYGISV